MDVINNFPTTCAEDCSSEITFPAAAVDPDCLNYEVYLSQIGDVIIRPTDAPNPFGATWTGDNATLSYTADTIDNAATDNLKSRRFRGIGSLGEAERTTRNGPYGTQVTTQQSAPFEFVIENVDAANWAFAKALDCQPTNYTVYLGNASHMFGQAEGMALSELEVQTPLGAGPDDVEQIIIRAAIKWKNTRYERTANNPFN